MKKFISLLVICVMLIIPLAHATADTIDLDSMPDLDDYFGKTREEIEAAFPDAVYDETSSSLYIENEDVYLQFQLGRNGTCIEIRMQDGNYGYKLRGFCIGLDVTQLKRLLTDEGLQDWYEEIGYLSVSDYKDIKGLDIECQGGSVVYIDYRPAKYAEAPVAVELKAGAYEGIRPDPVDDNDLIKYVGQDINNAMTDFDIPDAELFGEWVIIQGTQFDFEGSDAMYHDNKNGYDILFATGIRNGLDDIYNTEYITKITFSGTPTGDVPYTLVGLGFDMTQDEAEAHIASLDPEIAAHLAFYKSDDGFVYIVWSSSDNLDF